MRVAIFLISGRILFAQGAKTVLDGVYTEAQAARGEAAYEANCGRCHRDNLEGGAEALSLKGERFMEAWRDDTLDGVFTHIRTRMPRRPGGEPGSLPEKTYVDILAYILKANAFPPGTLELTTEAIANTLLVGREGQQPLPTNALVQVVGCLTAGPNDTSTLTRATGLARTRNAEETTAEELKKSAAKPLGTQTFLLNNLDDMRPGFRPDAYKGHKVQAKGVLTRRPGNDRIYVISLETLTPSCPPV